MGGKSKTSRQDLAERIQDLELLVQQLQAELEAAQATGPGKTAERPEPGRLQVQQLTSAFANLPGMYYRCLNEPGWTMELVSEGCLELTGYPAADYLSGKLHFGFEVIAAEDRERIWQEIQAALKRRTRFVLQYRIVTRTGETKWVWEKGGGVFDAEGRLRCLEGLIQDATELHATRESLGKHVSQLEDLSVLARALTEVESVEQLCSALAATLLLPEDVVNIGVYAKDEQQSELHVLMVDGLQVGLEAAYVPVPVGRGIIGQCALQRQPIVISDTSDCEGSGGYLDGQIRSQAAFPLITSGKLLGVLGIDSAIPEAFPAERLEALGAVAQQIAIVLERIRLLRNLRSELQQRRQAELERQSSEQLAAAMVRESPLGITIRHPQGRLIEANQAWLKFWNVTPESLKQQHEMTAEFFAQTILDFFGPEHAEKILRVHSEGGYHAVDEFEFEHPMAGHRWMSFKCYSLHRPDGNVGRIVSITEDITERRMAERGRAAAEKLMASAFQHSPIGVTVRSGSGRLLFFNDSWREIWGVDDTELEEHLELEMQGSQAMFSRTFGPEAAREVESLLAHGGSLRINDVRWERYGNPADVRWLDVLFFTVLDEAGAVSNLVTLTTDMTDKRLSEVRLRQSEEQLRQIINLVPHFIFAKGMDGRFILANEAVAEAYGCAVHELLGQRDADFDSNLEEVERFLADDQEVILNQRLKFIPEEQITDASGRLRYLQTTKIPFHTLADEAPAVLGVAIDISERKAAEASLRELNRLLSLVSQQAQELTAIESWEALEQALGQGLLETLGLVDLSILTMDEDGSKLKRIFSCSPTSNDGRSAISLTSEAGILEQCARSGVPVVVNDTTQHQEYSEPLPDGVLSQAAFPLIASNRLIGVINFDSPRKGSFTPDLVEGLAAIAQQVTVVIERIRLLESLREELAERKRQEQILSDSEQRLRTVIDTAADAIVVINEQGRIESFNTSAERIFGYRAKEALLQGVEILMDESDATRHLNQFRNYLANGESRMIGRSVEVTGRRRDGSPVPLELIVAEMNIGGERKFLGMMRDISTRREAQRALVESEQRYRALVSNLPRSAIILIDRDFRFVLADGPELSGMGFSKPALEGRRILDCLPSGLAEQVRDNVARAFRGESFSEEIHFGAEYFEYAYLPLCGSSAEVEFALILAQNITARTQAETALRDSEERLSALMEYSSDLVSILDSQGYIRYQSPAVARILGYAPRELLGQSAFGLIHPDDRARVKALYISSIRAPGSVGAAEYRARHADGHYVYLESIGSNRINVRGIEGIVVSSRDISERKLAEEDRRKLEAQIQHAQKLESLGVLAGGIAHDFNNLLVAILGNAGLALLELPPESAARHTVQQIETAAVRAAELTKQMLAYSGKGKFVVQPINLSRAVEEMVHLLQTVISKKAVLNLDFAAGLPAVEADVAQVRQVIMNLITNASDAIGDNNGAITVRTGLMYADMDYIKTTLISDGPAAGQYAYVEVVDTGVGMSSETLLRIFDPFFSTKFAGRGLGLAAVLGIMRGHRGTIKVYSEPGRGTTFKVLFPCSEVLTAHSPSSQSEEVGFQGSGTVLVVDDDESIRRVASSILRRTGYEVLTAADGAEALGICRARSNEFCCLLVDLTMPTMGGEELCRALREEQISLPVVMMSGYSEQEVSNLFQGQSFTRFLQKPFRPLELLQVLNEAIGEANTEPSDDRILETAEA